MSFEEITSAYPNITKLVGEDWLRKQLALPYEKRHILGAFLEKVREDKESIAKLQENMKSEDQVNELKTRIELLSVWINELDTLENCLSELKDEVGLATQLKKMRSDADGFRSSASEAAFTCYFKERGKMTMFPKIKVGNNTKEPDLSVSLDERPIFVEITTPQLAQVLKEKVGEVVPLKQRGVGQILDEFEENFSEAIEKEVITSEPIIIALDCSHSEIDQYEIEAALFGTPQIELLINKSTHELVDDRIKRKNDGLKMVQKSDMISAVIWAKFFQHKNGTLSIGGNVTENPRAKNKLTEKEISKLDFRN